MYGEIPPHKYLTGRFDPSQTRIFVEIHKLNIPANNRKHYLRKEVALALKQLYLAFKQDNPGVTFWVQSSTRNFYQQKYIWEKKWSGKTLVSGKKLNIAVKDPLQRARTILKYSSMPGTSRHHWGSDFDINVLNNNYYNAGDGKIIYAWMKKNASRYGFCQPYTTGRKAGYEEEKWHWSYVPLARRFLKDWNRLYEKGAITIQKKGLFQGAASGGHLAPIYVNSINGECM